MNEMNLLMGKLCILLGVVIICLQVESKRLVDLEKRF